MSDVTGVSSGSTPNMPPAPEAWLSFEQRMLQRRLARCLLRVDAALNEGRLYDAEAALDEARNLNVNSPDIAPRVERLAALRSPVAAPVSRNRARVAVIAAGILVVAAAGAGGAWYWQSQPASATPGVNVDAPALQLQTAATTPEIAHEPPQPRLQVIRETITAPVFTPSIVDEQPRLPAQGPPIAEAQPEPQPETVVMAVNRPETNPAPPPPELQPELRSDPVLPPPPVIEPLNRTNLDAIALPAARTSAPPPPPAPAKVPDESAFVRQVLEEYEEAYSTLDAAAASAIWPGVNRGALARAFQGLASQRVSLGDCSVVVTGQAARATCAGSATWEPKVGGGVRTEPRRWSFDLRKAGSAWRIERAITR